MNNRVLLLIGAGGSIPAGYPSTNEITQNLLTEEYIFYHSDGIFRYDPGSSSYQNSEVKIVQEILHQYYDNENVDNYESVFEVLAKLKRNRNDVRSPFYSDSRGHDRFLRQIAINADGIFQHRSINELYSLAFTYIKNQVRELLFRSRANADFSPLDRIYKPLIDEPSIKGIDIHTLNHDTLFEDYFSARQIDYADGFGEYRDGIAKWNDNFPIKSPIRIYKLHGSLNWLWFSKHELADDQSVPGEYLAPGKVYFRIPGLRKIRPEKLFDSINCSWVDGEDEYHEIENSDGAFLIGSDTKYYSYPFEPYNLLMYRFGANLDQYQKIIIIGYGWSDRAINLTLKEWAGRDQSRAILLITSGDEWKYQAGCPISRIKCVKDEGLESVNPNEILQFLELRNN